MVNAEIIFNYFPDFNDKQVEQINFLFDLYQYHNARVNVISRKDIDNFYVHHVLHSFALLKLASFEEVESVIDIGTGGGFPGIPLAIMRPELRGVLADSTGKKICAVQEFINKLKLSNVVAENSRVESNEFKEKYANTFDLIVSRSTVPLIILFRYSLPLIKEKAYMLAMKGGDLTEEFKKAETKYKAHIKKSTIYELAYKPKNLRNIKGKKLVLLELQK